MAPLFPDDSSEHWITGWFFKVGVSSATKMAVGPISLSLCFPMSTSTASLSFWVESTKQVVRTPARVQGAVEAFEPTWSFPGLWCHQHWGRGDHSRGPSGSPPCYLVSREAIGLDPASAQGRPHCHSFYLHMPHVSLVCFCPGKSNPYCEISMGSQSYTTRTLQDTLNPKWNFNCQFFIKDLYQDVLCLTMFDRDQFSPDGKV